ncbi:MAG TPA: polyphosphate polymerase domain-containing protein [Verrucomicrobiae bacterium]
MNPKTEDKLSTSLGLGLPPVIALLPTGPEVPALSLRYERKFLPDGLSLTEVLSVVRQHPALFHEPYPERWVNNLYFDTPERRHYHDHINGATSRIKVRVRWYGEPRGRAERPVLEFKTRHGLLGGKTAHRLPALELDGDLGHAASVAAIQSPDFPPALRVRLQGLEPALMNRYRRRYFCSADGALRLTLDWELQFFPPRGANGATRPRPHNGPAVIVELKYAEAQAEAAARAANEFPFRLTRCSKFVLGIECLSGV